MIIKEKFSLLKDVNNILYIDEKTLNNNVIDKSNEKMLAVLELIIKKTNHFSKKKVFQYLTNKKYSNVVKVGVLDNYVLPVSYNKPTDNIIINLSFFNTDDISANNPGPFNIYACLVYGIIFRALANKKFKLTETYVAPISNFLISLIIRAFGKQYGMLGSFSNEIVKVKFLLNCYILASFFGVKQDLFKTSSLYYQYDFRDIEQQISKIDFSVINGFVEALNKSGAMPNITRHTFAAKILSMYTFNFIPGLEDLARLMSLICASDISGNSISPTYISKYNATAYGALLNFSRMVFSK